FAARCQVAERRCRDRHPGVAQRGHVVMNRPAVEAGLALLEAGGDFADGIMAHEGKWLGGEIFVSFDKHAVMLLSKERQATRLLA
ncbi:MAG TPA: hypothetical protein PLI12_04430, partial [Acetobacteraceae bacterium]|nr:hypothetical protein [Acetobacteraceae bacterium]